MSRRSRLLPVVALVIALAGCGGATPPGGSTPTQGASAPASAIASAPASAAAQTPAPSAASATCDGTAAASPPNPSPDTNDPNAALYSSIEAKVAQIRGLTATTPVQRYVLDAAGLCAYLRNSFATDNPDAFVASSERAYKLLGLIPQNASLKQLFLNLLVSQVAGLYDDRTKQMYVVSSTGAIGPIEQITYAHEFTHALQDQAFGLRALVGDALDQTDRTLARTTLVEGDASLVMSLWARDALTSDQMAQVAAGADPAATAVLDATPAILKEPLLFPYTTGLAVVMRATQQSGGFAGVDSLFRNPPDTTEQVMHPDKLASREPAIPVAIPADLASRLGTGWTVALQDTLGEMELGILVRAGDPKAGSDPAVGWGGDRLALLEGPGGATAIVIDTRWDTAKQAGDFAYALGPYVQMLQAAGHSATASMPSADRVLLAVADSDATLGLLSTVLPLAQ